MGEKENWVADIDLCSGIGQSMWQVITGRVVSAVGAAGMVVIVSVLITGESHLSTKKTGV
jgi:hypothetical protein